MQEASLTPEQIIRERVEAHRERVQRELADQEEDRKALMADYFGGMRAKRIKGKPRRSSSTAVRCLVVLLDHLELKCRNPGWSLNWS